MPLRVNALAIRWSPCRASSQVTVRPSKTANTASGCSRAWKSKSAAASRAPVNLLRAVCADRRCEGRGPSTRRRPGFAARTVTAIVALDHGEVHGRYEQALLGARVWWPFGTWLFDLPDWGGLFVIGMVLMAPLVVIWLFWLLAASSVFRGH